MKVLCGENYRIRHILSALCLIAVAITATSCSELKSKHYVGEIITDKDCEHADSIESVWEVGEDAYYVRAAESNTFVAATLEWDKKQQKYTVISYPLIISQIGDSIFLNIKKDELYTILRLTCASKEDVGMLFTVNKDMMEEEIKEGRVKAREDDGHIILEGTKEEQDKFIEAHVHSMFSIDCGSLVRMISEKEKEKKTNNNKPMEMTGE